MERVIGIVLLGLALTTTSFAQAPPEDSSADPSHEQAQPVIGAPPVFGPEGQPPAEDPPSRASDRERRPLNEPLPPAPPPVLSNHQLLHKYVWSALGTEGVLSATLVS